MINHVKPDLTKLPGGWEPTKVPALSVSQYSHKIKILEDVFIVENVFVEKDCLLLIALFESAPTMAPVSVYGCEGAINEGPIGSMRTTMWAPKLAKNIWYVIKPFIDAKSTTSYTATDWWQEDRRRYYWEPVTVSPLLRFMCYKKGGEHCAHYDAAFFYEDGIHRTLMSFVVYLTSSLQDGATRFIDDNQKHLPIWDRNHNDWTRPVREEEIIRTILPQQGSILMFDHRRCHDVQRYTGDESRIIIRGDIIFKPGNNHVLENQQRQIL